LAQRAQVKTPHVFHCLHSIAENPKTFCPDSFAIFAGLERRHVDRIMQALADADLLPARKARECTEGRGTRLPAVFALPDEWLSFAQETRRWSSFTVETTFQEFIDYWTAQPGAKGVKLDWFATWRNWCRRSREPNGTWRPRRTDYVPTSHVPEPDNDVEDRCTPEDARRIMAEFGLRGGILGSLTDKI
jgi:hypothetical protein